MHMNYAAKQRAVAAALLGFTLATAGSAAAHPVIHTAPPSHATHSTASSHHSNGDFVHALVGSLVDSATNDAPADPDPERPLDMQATAAHPAMTVSVKSDADRYFEATGHTLPAVHDLIVLPPSAPGGDSTYMWPAN